MPIKLSSVPYKHSSIKIFSPATPNNELFITESTHSFASLLFFETKTPFPAARPSALSTIGYSQLSKKEYALSGSEKKLALPVGISFSKRNFLENIFEPSSRAPFEHGPNTKIFRSSR